jgi:hypothetical protein
MIVAYIGNFIPDHSTENHVRTALLSHGHTVVRIQENHPDQWSMLMDKMSEIDLILWTSTRAYSLEIGFKRQVQMLAAAKAAGVPTVAYHLDRWAGLDREPDLYSFPYFRCSLVITADGGPDWASIGINHAWLPPAVSLPETELGTFDATYTSEITFVGTWRGYHREWEHRAFLIDWLKTTYPRSVRFWPRPGQPAVRGKALRDLYASVKIVVGDSCLVGDAHHYWSDRIPETVGRGGFLIHPEVDGLEEHFTPGEHLMTWPAGNFDRLYAEIERARREPEWAHGIAMAGRDHVRAHHTYEARVPQILALV